MSQYLKVQSLLSETLLERRAIDKPLDKIIGLKQERLYKVIRTNKLRTR